MILMAEQLSFRKAWKDKILRKGLMYVLAEALSQMFGWLLTGMILSFCILESASAIQSHIIASIGILFVGMGIFSLEIMKRYYRKMFKIWELENKEYLGYFD